MRYSRDSGDALRRRKQLLHEQRVAGWTQAEIAAGKRTLSKAEADEVRTLCGLGGGTKGRRARRETASLK